MLSAYARISEYLREQLNVLDGADRLPTDHELSKRFSVSRQTARRAYADLMSEGLVERIPGKGTYPSRAHRFTRPIGVVDDLLAYGEGHEVHVLSPLTFVRNTLAATQLGLPTNIVAFV